MADIGKNGYSYTGYTEPFILPEGATIASAALLTAIVPVQFAGIVGGLPIENTEYKNAGLFVSPASTVTGTSFTANYINFDNRMDTGHGVWILDIGGTYVTVDSVTYDNSTQLYTIGVSASVTVTLGESYRVVGRIPDTGAASASQSYTAGDKVLEIYP